MKMILFFALTAIALQLITSNSATAAATLSLESMSEVNESTPTEPTPPAKSEDQYISYNFGNVRVNTSSSIVYSVKNTGSTPLKIEKIIYSGAYYHATSACPDVLEAGKSCNTRITYWPAFEGMSVGRVIWYTSDNNIILDLWGTGSRF